MNIIHVTRADVPGWGSSPDQHRAASGRGLRARRAGGEVRQRRVADVRSRLSMWLLTIVAYSSMNAAASSSEKSSAA
jgi:hypothetical protein